MQTSLNPWITAPTGATDEETPVGHVPPAAVISTPLKGMVEPDTADRLASRTLTGTATLWVVGSHGGAGENRVADLLNGARPSGHCWPVPDDGSKPRVLLVCRSDIRGLTTAQSTLTQWASGAAPEVELIGLAVLADAPGKTPKALRDFAAIVGGGAPRLWLLPWVEAWRHDGPTTTPPARDYQRFLIDIAALATEPKHHNH
ncbi:MULTISPECIES: DUF6668 family protein [Paenarthrobacter]|uniref:Uncharacterized protein n=1 Tax=Paenarthrobacter nicotinovorans TaxID=29320 RepID=Q8GAE3_PAENI|nr:MULTISPECIES: DUF6668 family protein [Paenarthrobacter]BCW13015.1 hypothetical protein NtRootA2_42970 [Arthrobacter sp. NtRootA2]BCW17260.1 hypothetical protein NtRootA4_42390 [Arthrobacter sp. NtRootA4]BCW25368.1 hypothetical protein NtRootC7_42350 [Arthrobacter sp. NtRootC7]BCW29571.1 hypothetical protein NtRootC45_41710 [Arthrobacter sp. NtRootC45]BCW33894.1 hypothetical protein NtRootD5_42250 [Arthrobacter sp. NtRootD5]